MPTVQELEQQLLQARGIGKSLVAVLISLMSEHAKLIGGDKEDALRRTRDILNQSLAQLKATGTTATGEKVDVAPEIHRRVGILLDEAERNARRLLGLTPSSRARH